MSRVSNNLHGEILSLENAQRESENAVLDFFIKFSLSSRDCEHAEIKLNCCRFIIERQIVG